MHVSAVAIAFRPNTGVHHANLRGTRAQRIFIIRIIRRYSQLKIAIISDVHGNLVALESIIPAIREADHIVCLGDVAATGPQPLETIRFLRKVKWPCVMGNTDERLANSEPEDFKRMKIPEEERLRMVELDRWTSSRLGESDRRFLAGFRATIEVPERYISILCYHGSPRSNVEQILPTTPDDDLAKILGRTRARVYAGGHTHIQMVRRLGGSLVINPGSVGLPFSTDEAGRALNPAWAEYVINTSTADESRVELRRRRYSLGTLKEVVQRSGMPDPDWWLKDWW